MHLMRVTVGDEISQCNENMRGDLHTILRLVAVTGVVALLIAVAALELARLGALLGDVAFLAAVVARATTTTGGGTVTAEVAHYRRLAVEVDHC